MMCRHAAGLLGIGAGDMSSPEGIRSSLFMVQEYVEGGSLKKVVSEQMVDYSVS